MNNVSGTDALGFDRDGRWNNALRTVSRAQHRDMIDAIEQRNDRPDSPRILERAECRLQLRGLHCNPEHIDRRNFGSHGNIDFEVTEGALQSKGLGILRERLATDYQSDRVSNMRQTSSDQPANAPGSENRVLHWIGIRFRHAALDARYSVLLHGRGKAFHNLGVTQRVVAALGSLKDSVDHIVRRRDAAPLQPEQYIRFSAHGTDVDDLL